MRAAAPDAELTPVHSIAFEMGVRERRNGGCAWGGGGTPSAMGLHSIRAFEGRPLIIQVCGDAGAVQARRAPRRSSVEEERATQEQTEQGA